MYFQDAECRAVLDAALALAAAGMAVFPCIYAKKEPATKRGFYDATTNPATIRRWFGGNFKRNVAVRTGLASGAWVLDVDDPNSLTVLENRHGALPTTRRSASSRGLHLWFKTTGIPIECSTGRVAPGIDVKAEGGYVVAAPSIHPTGVVYEWLNEEHVAEAPAWLVALARKPTPPRAPPPSSNAPRGFCGRLSAYASAALMAEVEVLAATPKGGRNHQLNRAAFSLHQLVAGGELEVGEVERCLIDAATANGLVAEDGIRQCLATIRSGARAGMLHPRSRSGGGA